MPIVNGFVQMKAKDGSVSYLRVSSIVYIQESVAGILLVVDDKNHVDMRIDNYEPTEIFKVLGLLGIAPEVFGSVPPESITIAHVSV